MSKRDKHAAEGAAAGFYVGGPVGGAAGYALGGLFGDEGTKYGRYYHPISADDSDYQEDTNEQTPYGRFQQNIQDRWIQPENQSYNPVSRIIYRNADRAEDIPERRYAMIINKEGRAEKMGLGGRNQRLEQREQRVTDRAMKRSEFQEEDPRGIFHGMNRNTLTATPLVAGAVHALRNNAIPSFQRVPRPNPQNERIKRLRALGLHKYADYLLSKIQGFGR